MLFREYGNQRYVNYGPTVPNSSKSDQVSHLVHFQLI